MKRVHLDHNATAPLRPEVRELLAQSLVEPVGNASSLHARGRAARLVLDEARERVAGALAVREDDVVFTSGGTESNNLAVLGAVRAAGEHAGLVTSTIEHSSVLGPAERLEREGHPVRRVGVDAQGRIDPAEVAAAAHAVGAALVSIGGANGEIGVRAPLAAIAASLEAPGRGATGAEGPHVPIGYRRPAFHADLVQLLGRAPVDLTGWGVDLATFAAHKVGGPPGVGLLIRRGGLSLQPLFFGGGQEGDLRPGTENVAAIAGAALAVELAVSEEAEHAGRMRALEVLLWSRVRAFEPRARLLGPPLEAHDERIAGTLNVLVPGLDGRVLVTRLDLAGLEVSAGSACASGSLEPSHVLRALGLDDEAARAGLRISLGRETTDDDVLHAVEILRRTLGGDVAT